MVRGPEYVVADCGFKIKALRLLITRISLAGLRVQLLGSSLATPIKTHGKCSLMIVTEQELQSEYMYNKLLYAQLLK